MHPQELSEQREQLGVRTHEVQQLQAAMHAKEAKLAELLETKASAAQEGDTKVRSRDEYFHVLSLFVQDRLLNLAEQRLQELTVTHSNLKSQFELLQQQLTGKVSTL